MKNLIIPDVHGRTFWKRACNNIDEYDKVIFLGDYLDPYNFEGITAEDAIVNFEEIIDFANEHRDKVVLLLGNHDMPYYSVDYFNQSHYWSRHMWDYREQICGMFKSNHELFQIAYEDDYCLYSHAGVHCDWMVYVHNIIQHAKTDLTVEPTAESLNNLLNSKLGLGLLYVVSQERGGRARAGSPIWSDIHERLYMQEECNPEGFTKYQIFGHTLQAYSVYGEIEIGPAVVEDTFAMLDTCEAYIYDGKSIKKYE